MKMKIISTMLTATIGLLFATGVSAAESPALTKPVKSVFDHYLKIQTELAKDSLKGVDAEAKAIIKEVEGDSAKMLPPDVAKQAKALAEAKDLKAARDAFKPLSDSLIKYLTDHKVTTGRYYVVYCAELKASWLQEADKTVRNPYLGQDKSKCGVVLNVH